MPRTLARRRERSKYPEARHIVLAGRTGSLARYAREGDGARTKVKWPKVSPIEHALPRGTLCDVRSRGTILSSAVKSETESAGPRGRDLLTLPRIGLIRISVCWLCIVLVL